MSELPDGTKLFTVAEANNVLPLVRSIVKDLVAMSRDVIERRERLALLRQSRKSSAGDVYSDELLDIEAELERETEQLQGYVEELRELGVEPKSATEGLVDFPSLIDDHVVYLCWKLGEPEVMHWHELDAGFRGRQLLTADVTGSTDEIQ